MIYVIGLHFCPFDFMYQFRTWLSPFMFVNHGHLYIVSRVQLVLENLRNFVFLLKIFFFIILIIKGSPFYI